MENLQARAIEAAEKYLAHKGYKVIETSPESGADVVARDEETLVFVDVAAREGAESAAARWLAAHAEGFTTKRLERPFS